MKRIVLIILAVLLTASAFAQRLTEQQAKERVVSFLSSKQGRAFHSSARVNASELKSVSLGIDGVYGFNVDGGGYVVAGGDERVAPVLGYGDNGALSYDAIPENMKSWLEGYARQIAFAAEHNFVYSANSQVTDHQPIEPMVTSKWGQGNPYNRLCPVADQDDPSKGLCPTGCVATAMAQVVNYHKWPRKAEGKGYAMDHYQTPYEIDMSSDYFDWGHMIDGYSNEKNEVIAGNETQWDAVSLLMRDMGYSVYMHYAPSSSGAPSIPIPYALVTNFGYDKGTHLEYRDWYTDEQWDSLVYDNLAKYGPMTYSGVTEKEEGHEFVCDGYRGEGYYHFNWGWNGLSDGYFLLSALNPEVHGTGGSTRTLAFNYNHDIVVGICKPREDSQSVVNLYQRSDLTLANGLIDGHFQCLVSVNESIEFGLWTKNLETEEEAFHYSETMNVDSPDNLNGLEMNCDVPDGKYKVMPVFRKTGEEEWHFFRSNNKVRRYLLLDVVGGEKTYSIDEPFEYGQFEIPELYVMPNAEFTKTVKIQTNGANYDAKFIYKLYDEQTNETVMESEPVEVEFSLEQDSYGLDIDLKVGKIDKSHTYKLQLFDGESLIGEKTGITAVDKPVFEEIEPLTIAEVVDGKIYKKLKTCHVSFKYKISGFFTGGHAALAVKYANSSIVNVLDNYVTFEDNVLSMSEDLNAGKLIPSYLPIKTVELSLLVQYDDKHYICLKDGSKIGMTLEVVDEVPTGIEGINAEGVSADERRYDLQGRPVTKPSQHSIYVVKGKKVLAK